MNFISFFLEVQFREQRIQSLSMQIEIFSCVYYSPLNLLELLTQNVKFWMPNRMKA